MVGLFKALEGKIMKFSFLKKVIVIFASLVMLIAATPYSYNSNENVAKAEIVTSSGLVFQSGSIIGYRGTSPIVNIPSSIGGEAVTSILGAFYGNKIITQVTIPEGVTSISALSFFWCPNLETLNIPASVTTIESGAIANCENISINLSAENASFVIGADGVLYNTAQTRLILYLPQNPATTFTVPATVTRIFEYAFAYSANLTSVTIPKETTKVGAGSFNSCSSLTSIIVDADNPNYLTANGVLYSKNQTTLIAYPGNKSGTDFAIPNSVATISEMAFTGCENLTNLAFGSSVKTILYALYGETSIKNVYVSSSNPNFSSLSGVLASKDGTVLYYYPSGRTDAEYTVPGGVTTIGELAFALQPYIQKVTLPADVVTIQAIAFSECESLEAIVINAAKTTFGTLAIAPSDGLSIWGYAYSDAQAYADKNNITFYTIGKPSEWEYDVITSTTCDITGYIGSKTEIYVPSIIDGKWVTNVSVTTFGECSELEYITFSESISSIEVSNSDGSMYMFQDCISLREIYFPSTLDTMITNGAPEKPFKGAISLVNIIVDENNSSYYDVNGVLFNSSKMLIHYPSGRTAANYSIPNGTRDILYSAFSNIYLKTVTVPGTVTSLLQGPDPIFKNNIETVYLQEGVEIVEDVFSSSKPMYICFPESAIYISGFDVEDIHTFYVFENSVAHTYAVANNIKYLFLCLVSFDSAGGSSVASQIIPVGSSVTAPTNVTKEGYIIQGWFTDAELTNRWSFSTDIAESSMTLYAKWAEGYAIIYHMNGGVNNKDNPSYYLVNQTVVLKDATKTNYLFDGWYTDSSCALKYKYDTIEKGTTGVVELWADWWVSSTSGGSNSINSSILVVEKQPEITFKNFPGEVLYMQDNQEITVKGTIEIKYGDVQDISVEYSGKTEKLYKYQDGQKRISTFSYTHTFNVGEIDYNYSENYKISVHLSTDQTYYNVLPIYKSKLMTEVVGSYDSMLYFDTDKLYELRAMAVSGNYFEVVSAAFSNLTPEMCEIKEGNILVPKAAGVAIIQTKIVMEDGSVLKYKNEFTISDKTVKEPSRLERELQCQCYGKYCSGLPEDGIDPALIALIEKIEAEIGKPVYIVSGYRCEEYNKVFGGSENSEHIHGTAADIWVQDMTMEELYEICDRLNTNGGVGQYSDHIHIDTRGENLRWSGEN